MKVHGYKIKLTAFLPAEPFSIDDLKAADETFAELKDWLDEHGIGHVEFRAEPGSRVSRAIPDEPKAAEAQVLEGQTLHGEMFGQPFKATIIAETPPMPPIPAAMRRT